MSTYFPARNDGDVTSPAAMVAELIRDHYPYLNDVPIGILFKEKASKPRGSDTPTFGKITKVSPKNQAMLEAMLYSFVSELQGRSDKYKALPMERAATTFEGQFQFMIEIGFDRWSELSNKVRLANIDHLLARIHSEEDEKTGEMKHSLRNPPIQVFPEIINRHGVGYDDGANRIPTLDLDTKYEPTIEVRPAEPTLLLTTDEDSSL